MYIIGGKNIKVEGVSTSIAFSILLEELKIYEKAISYSVPDLTIFYSEEPIEFEPLSRNPSNHVELKDGYLSILPHSDIAFRVIDNHPTIFFRYKNNFSSWRRRLRGMQFTHPYEEVGQIFHEAVLTPAFLHFFSETIALIHGSSLVDKGNNGVIFAGTGGVGKTTTELELILNHGYKFLADDISILDDRGILHPNYSFPKIYGYNILSKPELQTRLFKKRDLVDKLWWKLQSKLKSANKIRRRADLNHFYGENVGGSSPLKKVYILFRTKTEKISVESIQPEFVCQMNNEVLKTEFPVLYNNMAFHAYNNLRSSAIKFSYDKIFDNIFQVQKKAFSKDVNFYLVNIPLSYDAKELSLHLPEFINAHS